MGESENDAGRVVAPHQEASVYGGGFDQRRGGRVQFRNLDPPGFQRLGHFADQIDMQHPVHMARPGHADMIGQMKAAFKRAGGNATVQKPALVRAVRFWFSLAGRYQQRLFPQFDVKVRIGKTGDGNGNLRRILGQLQFGSDDFGFQDRAGQSAETNLAPVSLRSPGEMTRT